MCDRQQMTDEQERYEAEEAELTSDPGYQEFLDYIDAQIAQERANAHLHRNAARQDQIR